VDAVPAPTATTRVRFSDDTAWRLFFHALPPSAATARIEVSGRADLAAPLTSARAVIV
jgi:hypothetical protein